MKQLSLVPYKVIELPTGIRVNHFRNGRVEVETAPKKDKFTKFYEWYTKTIKGGYISDKQFEVLINKFKDQ